MEPPPTGPVIVVFKKRHNFDGVGTPHRAGYYSTGSVLGSRDQGALNAATTQIAPSDVDSKEPFLSAHTVWITFDLGNDGDYEGLYAWLDAHDANGCGESVAVLAYDCEGSIPDKIRDDLTLSIGVDADTVVYVIYRDPTTNENRGAFIFGERSVPVWNGFASSPRNVDPWRRYGWTPPCGTVFQVRERLP